MNLQEAMTRYRTLILEGRDGLDRSGLLAELARQGFSVGCMADTLHHVDPTQPFREFLAGSGRLVVDGSLIRELVYGPLRQGRSRVTWIQALDFAEAVAERDGALLHVTDATASPAAHLAASGADPQGAENRDASAAYDRAFRTLAQHVPVVTVHAAPTGPSAPGHFARLPGQNRRRPQRAWSTCS
jgi:hypothetical protein